MSTHDLKQWYLKRILNNLLYVLALFDEKDGLFRAEEGYDIQYRHCLRPLAYLYRNKLDGNPYYQDKSILDKIIRQGDLNCTVGDMPLQSQQQHGFMGVEWVAYNTMECIEWLGDDLGPARRDRWTDALALHIEQMKIVSNYVATSPNHFIYRAALLYRAGQMFDRQDWRRTGQFLARQVCKTQMPDGYWDEAVRGHGPSTNYHRTHLHGLDLYYRASGDEQVRETLYKAIDFGVRTSYRDGTPIETFDARHGYLATFAAGMAAGALSRTPQGRRVLRNQIARLDELNVSDAGEPCGFALNWYAFATTDFMLDCYRFFEDGPEEPLPQEQDHWRHTFALNGQAGIGGAAVLRDRPWLLALCAAQSDTPRFSQNTHISERQSGFSVYHDRTALIVGGGNRMRNHVPLVNAIVLTGWKDVDCLGGRFPDQYVGEQQGLPGTVPGLTEARDPVKCCYYPIRRRAELGEHGGSLHLEFLHANIRLDLNILGPDELAIDYWFEAVDTKKILLQVPIPVFWPLQCRVDEQCLTVRDLEDVRTLPVSRAVLVRSRSHPVRYELPAGQTASFTYPLQAIRNWEFRGINYAKDVRFQPLYVVGMFSCEFHEQTGQGRLLTISMNA